MKYFHKDLCHLLSRNLSNLSLVVAAKAAKAAAGAAVAAAAASPNQSEEVAMRNDTLPVSLLFRANLFKDGFILPRRVNCLKLISNNKDLGFYAFPLRNLNWNTDSLRFYAQKQAITWPTCTQASTAGSTSALMWAGMNRCSCIYDMRHTFLKLSPIEKEMLSWLEKEVRPKLHAKATFHGKVDIPIKRNTANGFLNGNCLWNAFISGKERILPSEDLDDIEKHVHWYDMTKAAEFNRSIICKVQRDCLKNMYRYLSSTDSSDEEEAKIPSNLKASSPSNQDDSKWN